jgi:1,4-dihydroxy-2-naphthoate octaprenyltransferase
VVYLSNIDAKLKKLKLILRLARLHFLIPGFMLYLLGYSLALLNGSIFDFGKFVFGYLIFGTAHLSVSFSNDYFDRYADRNSIKTAFSGGSKILVEYPKLAPLALKIAIFLLVSSVMFNAIFTTIYAYSFVFFIFGLLAGLLGWFYSAPPLNFAYRGLGELSTMLAVGIFMPGMGHFVAAGTLGSLFPWFILPLSCYGLFFIITVELPDVESDILGHKKNFLVIFGRTTGKTISVVATLIGTLSLALIFFFAPITEIVDVLPFVVFSSFPLLASIIGVLQLTNTRKITVNQVMFNMATMILFLLLIDMNLVFQLSS